MLALTRAVTGAGHLEPKLELLNPPRELLGLRLQLHVAGRLSGMLALIRAVLLAKLILQASSGFGMSR